MPKGFFRGVSLHDSKPPAPRQAMCGACGLYKDTSCITPKMPVWGQGRKEILIVGSCPTENDDDVGRPWSSSSGVWFIEFAKQLGFDVKKDAWTTYAAICHTSNLSQKHVEWCQPNVIKAIKQHKPKKILLLGTEAVQSVIGHTWKESPGSASRWAGFAIPDTTFNAWIMATRHPSEVAPHVDRDKGLVWWYRNHLESFLALEGRPAPAEKDAFDVVYDTDKAAFILRKMSTKRGCVCFDFETNMLKPDSGRAAIVSCAVSWKGQKTIAFPWEGEAIKAMSELLLSDVPKIGSNIKFEDRWFRKVTGQPAANWVWDTMLNAHILDCRKSVCSVKFQSYVQLGKALYNSRVDEYFTSKGSNVPNKIRDVPLKDLLEYNAKDALYEYQIADSQCQKLFGQSIEEYANVA